MVDESHSLSNSEIQQIDEQPLRDAGYPSGPVSMGGGRKLEPYGKCTKSPDGKHHYTAVSCIQSVEHFVCDYCRDGYYD